MNKLDKIFEECERNALPDSEINLSEMPELTKNDFARGHFPNWKPIKKMISIRLDADIIETLKSQGKGYQTRINEILRNALAKSSH